ncbi:MAG: flagellar hook-length control protein FliK, partial [bacterium]
NLIENPINPNHPRKPILNDTTLTPGEDPYINPVSHKPPTTFIKIPDLPHPPEIPIEPQILITSAHLARSQGFSQAIVTLTPPQWGKVLIVMKTIKETLKVELFTKTAEVRQELMDHTPQLKDLLHRSGFDKIEISIRSGEEILAERYSMDSENDNAQGDPLSYYNYNSPSSNISQEELYLTQDSESFSPRHLGYNTFELTA